MNAFGRKPRNRQSPGYMLEWAAVLSIGFVIAHLAGLREYTSVLNGTIGPSVADWQLSAFLGIVYVAIYLLFVIVVPALIVSAGILKIWQKCFCKGETKE